MDNTIIQLLDTNTVTRCTGGKTKKRRISELANLDKYNRTWNRLIRGVSIHTVDMSHNQPGSVYLPYTAGLEHQQHRFKRVVDLEPLVVEKFTPDSYVKYEKYDIIKLEGSVNKLHACNTRVLSDSVLFVKDGRAGIPKAMIASDVYMLFRESDMVFVLCDAGGRPGWVPLQICRMSQAIVTVDTIVKVNVQKPVNNCKIMLVSGNFLIGGGDISCYV